MESLLMDQIVVQGRRQVEIESRHGLSSESIYRDHLGDNGVPVILTDTIKEWRALSSWSFEFFKRRYGSQTVVPGIGVYGKSRRVMKLSHFIDYVEAPSSRPRGFWIDLNTRLPPEEKESDKAAPLYLHDQTAFLEHPELLEDVRPDPQCLDDWLALLPGNFQQLLQ